MVGMTEKQGEGGLEIKTPHAHWNQQEYDRAIHRIQQQRHLELDVKFMRGSQAFTGDMVRIYTERSPFVDGDVFTTSKLDADGRLQELLFYGQSMVEIEMQGTAGGAGGATDSISLYWYHPGEWFDSISLSLDLGRFSLLETQPARRGAVSFDFAFDPSMSLSSFQPSFGNIIGAQLPDRGESSTDIAGLHNGGTGWVRLDFHLKEFFERWNENYTKPYTVNDTIKIYGSVTLTTPPGFYKTIATDRCDQKFSPGRYGAVVTVEGDNPYLDVPLIEPIEEVYYRFSRDVIVTADML